MKAELEKARTESHDKIKLLEETLATTEIEMNRIVQEKQDLDKEHEDLLVMLTEQDAKVVKYKVVLRFSILRIIQGSHGSWRTWLIFPWISQTLISRKSRCLEQSLSPQS